MIAPGLVNGAGSRGHLISPPAPDRDDLIHGMERRGGSLGLATLCVSGGLGIALELSRN
jgi:hypothetical protein